MFELTASTENANEEDARETTTFVVT